MDFLFLDRHHAGRVLGTKLVHYAGQPDVLVLALPRGGVPVGFEVAQAIGTPLDIYVVRKLGVPGHEELAMGAIATGGVRVLNDDVIRSLGIPLEVINAVTEREGRELHRREGAYRGHRPPREVESHTVILVDDGLATGATMRAGIAALRQRRPRKIVVGVPTAAPDTCREFQEEVDEIVCATTPDPFLGVGRWYEDFSQTSDQEVHALLGQAWQKESVGA